MDGMVDILLGFLQAIVIYILVLGIGVFILFYVIEKTKQIDTFPHVWETDHIVEELLEQECIRPAGCKILQDGTVEYE
jgi:hypothetical protein|tara:strand:+ start:1524 stop:1757 length:234 start_codon:yes stop_codon:yes gene_type:complete